MPLDSSFRHADRIVKARVRTPRGARRYKQGIGTVIVPDIPGLANKGVAEAAELSQKISQANSLARALTPITDDTEGYLSSWEMEEAQKVYAWLFQWQKDHRDKINPDVTSAMAAMRAAITMQNVVHKARKVVDGDGDGFVYDGTPRKRPATPAEAAAGKAQRAAAKKALGRAMPAARAQKLAPAKSAYDKRYDKFQRAINQAIRSKDPKKIKEVKYLIDVDLDLKKPDRDDLNAILAARSAGKPDPAPVKGGNREKRTVAAPAAKKAAAKPPAKKVAEKKPERLPARRPDQSANSRLQQAKREKKVPETPKPAAKKTEGNMKVYRQFEEEIKDQLANVKPERLGGLVALFLRQINADPDMDAAEKNALKELLARQHSVAEKRVAANPQTTSHGPRTNAWMRLAARDIKGAGNFRKLKGLVTQISNKQASGQISTKEANVLREMVYRRLDELGLDRNGNLKRPVQPKSVLQRAREALSPKKATTFGSLPETPQQVREARKIMNAPSDLIKEIEGVQNIAELEVIRDRLRHKRNDPTLFEAIKQNPGLVNAINDAYRNRKKELEGKAKQKTVVPKAPPGAARQRAKERLPGLWSRDLAQARNEVEIEGLMDRLESDKSLSDEDFNRIAAILNERMKAFESSQNKPAVDRLEQEGDAADLGRKPVGRKAGLPEPKWAGIEDESPAGLALESGMKVKEVLNADGLFEYMEAHPERFDITRKKHNGATSYQYFVTDKKTGEKLFFKQTDNNGPADMFGDGVNEVVAAKVGRAAYGKLFLDTNFADSPDGNGNARIRMDHGEEHALANGGQRFRDTAMNLQASQLADPAQPVQLAVFDYLINNTDRHRNNFGYFTRDDGKKVIVPLDAGAAFNGHLDHPPGMRPEEYQKRARGGIVSLIGDGPLTDEGILREYRAAVKKFKGVDFQDIIVELAENNPNMADYELAHLRGAYAYLIERIEILDGLRDAEVLSWLKGRYF